MPKELNDQFLDMMERYFECASVANDARPDLHYQVGLTPAGVEMPRVLQVCGGVRWRESRHNVLHTSGKACFLAILHADSCTFVKQHTACFVILTSGHGAAAASGGTPPRTCGNVAIQRRHAKLHVNAGGNKHASALYM